MTEGPGNPRSTRDSAGPIALSSDAGRIADEEVRTPYAVAQAGLSELVDAAVAVQRVEAMQAAMRVDLIFLTVSYARGAEEAFTAPSLSSGRRHEMAHRAVTSELATALHVPERTMERMISEAWALSTELPATLAALRAGDITAQHASVVVEATTDLGEDPGLRARLDEQFALAAATTTAATLRRRARELRESLQRETLAERHAAARAGRRVEFEPAHDGMAWLHLHVPACDAMLIRDRLDRVARSVDEHDGPTGTAAPHETTPDQVRADAARDLLLHGNLPAESEFGDAARRVRPTVHVTVPVLTLIGTSDEPADLDGYGPIDADTARRLAAIAPSFTRILTHPVSGTVLDVDRTSYRPPADLERWLQVRDGTCRFPGCNRRAARCEVDHTIDAQYDGRTAYDNLAHVCPLHHHLKHETSWSVRHHAGGVLEWRSPAGRVHLTHPRQRIPVSAEIGPPGAGTPLRRSGAPPTPPF